MAGDYCTSYGVNICNKNMNQIYSHWSSQYVFCKVAAVEILQTETWKLHKIYVKSLKIS